MAKSKFFFGIFWGAGGGGDSKVIYFCKMFDLVSFLAGEMNFIVSHSRLPLNTKVTLEC